MLSLRKIFNRAAFKAKYFQSMYSFMSEELDAAISHLTETCDAAVLARGQIGSWGFRLAPDTYNLTKKERGQLSVKIEALRALCDKHGLLLKVSGFDDPSLPQREPCEEGEARTHSTDDGFLPPKPGMLVISVIGAGHHQFRQLKAQPQP